MQFPKKAKLVISKVLQADAEFQNSLGNRASGLEKQRQLATAVKVALDEFIDVAASLWPEFRTEDASERPGNNGWRSALLPGTSPAPTARRHPI
jgi:hypothetical protein